MKNIYDDLKIMIRERDLETLKNEINFYYNNIELFDINLREFIIITLEKIIYNKCEKEVIKKFGVFECGYFHKQKTYEKLKENNLSLYYLYDKIYQKSLDELDIKNNLIIDKCSYINISIKINNKIKPIVILEK